MSEKLLEEIKKRLECMILINYKGEESEKEKLKRIVNCLGLRETARLLGKDPGNLHRMVNDKGEKKK